MLADLVDLRAHHAAAASTAGSGACSSSPPSLYSLGHGGNDAQKTIGIIWMLLIAAGYTGQRRPGADLGGGRLLRRDRPRARMFGGWRIVKTMGQRITKLKPGRRLLRRDRRARSRCSSPPRSASRSRPRTPSPARSSASARRRTVSAVRWGVAGNIVWAWILTIPCSAFIAGLAWWIGRADLLAVSAAVVADAGAPSALHLEARPSPRRPSRSAAPPEPARPP